VKYSAYDFARACDARVAAVSAADYHMRRRPVKRLLEEVYPLSRLALLYQKAGAEVQVEAFENSSGTDGHIWVEGFAPSDFHVELTYADYGRDDKLRSELLMHQGFAPGAGPIERDKKTKKIHATMEAEDTEAPIKKLGASVRKRFEQKAVKPYSTQTVLLIAFDLETLRGRGWWKLLFDAIDDAGGVRVGRFQRVYLFNWSSNELQKIA
jgi:hypothetical protein